MKFKLAASEKKWVLYDVGNSAFTLIVATILPIYFNYIAQNENLSSTDYIAYWGYAMSVSTIIVAILGPVLGTVSDLKGWKKKIFMVTILVGALGCAALGFVQSWLWFLCLFVIAKTAYSLSLVVYDAMLTDVTDEDRMDKVSSHGYAWGYIGSCIPFAACLVLALLYDKLGLEFETAMAAAFILIAVWWVVLTLPLFTSYEQKYYTEHQKYPVKSSFKRLGSIFGELKNNKKVLLFLLAFFFYIDGVYTIIDMATAYGSAMGLDSTGLLLALLVTQIVAFPSSIIMGWLSGKVESEKLITVCICAYFVIAMVGAFMTTQIHFWILAIMVGMFQGGIQALSRSYFAKIIPPNKSGEYFGIYDICGKGAAFLGTTVMSLVSQLTGNANLGVLAISAFFIVGLILFRTSVKSGR